MRKLLNFVGFVYELISNAIAAIIVMVLLVIPVFGAAVLYVIGEFFFYDFYRKLSSRENSGLIVSLLFIQTLYSVGVIYLCDHFG